MLLPHARFLLRRDAELVQRWSVRTQSDIDQKEDVFQLKYVAECPFRRVPVTWEPLMPG